MDAGLLLRLAACCIQPDVRGIQADMEKRALGKSGLEVVPLTLGGNVFGWTIDQAKSFDVLDAFVDRGFDFIDTADVY